MSAEDTWGRVRAELSRSCFVKKAWWGRKSFTQTSYMLKKKEKKECSTDFELSVHMNDSQ